MKRSPAAARPRGGAKGRTVQGRGGPQIRVDGRVQARARRRAAPIRAAPACGPAITAPPPGVDLAERARRLARGGERARQGAVRPMLQPDVRGRFSHGGGLVYTTCRCEAVVSIDGRAFDSPGKGGGRASARVPGPGDSRGSRRVEAPHRAGMLLEDPHWRRQ